MCDKVGAAADFSTAVTLTADAILHLKDRPVTTLPLTETVINLCEQFVLMQSLHVDQCLF